MRKRSDWWMLSDKLEEMNDTRVSRKKILCFLCETNTASNIAAFYSLPFQDSLVCLYFILNSLIDCDRLPRLSPVCLQCNNRQAHLLNVLTELTSLLAHLKRRPAWRMLFSARPVSYGEKLCNKWKSLAMTSPTSQIRRKMRASKGEAIPGIDLKIRGIDVSKSRIWGSYFEKHFWSLVGDLRLVKFWRSGIVDCGAALRVLLFVSISCFNWSLKTLVNSNTRGYSEWMEVHDTPSQYSDACLLSFSRAYYDKVDSSGASLLPNTRLEGF